MRPIVVGDQHPTASLPRTFRQSHVPNDRVAFQGDAVQKIATGKAVLPLVLLHGLHPAQIGADLTAFSSCNVDLQHVVGIGREEMDVPVHAYGASQILVLAIGPVLTGPQWTPDCGDARDRAGLDFQHTISCKCGIQIGDPGVSAAFPKWGMNSDTVTRTASYRWLESRRCSRRAPIHRRAICVHRRGSGRATW